MKKEDTQLAYNRKKEIIHIREAKKSESFYCISCNEYLIVKKGDKNKHHFSHKNTTNCKGSVESLLHIFAKKVIKEKAKIFLPLKTIESTLYSEYNSEFEEVVEKHFNKEFNIRNVEIERKVEDSNSYRSDIKCVIDYENNKSELYIEIYVTHKTEEKKIEFYKENKKTCIEIDLSELKDEIDWKIKNSKNETKEIIKDIKYTIEEYIYDLEKNNDKFNFISQYILEKNKIDNLIKKNLKKINNYIFDIILEEKKIKYNFEPCFEEGKYKNIIFDLPTYPYKDKNNIIIDEIIEKDYLKKIIKFNFNNEIYYIKIVNLNELDMIDKRKKTIYILIDYSDLVLKKEIYKEDIVKKINNSKIELNKEDYYFYDKQKINKILKSINQIDNIKIFNPFYNKLYIDFPELKNAPAYRTFYHGEDSNYYSEYLEEKNSETEFFKGYIENIEIKNKIFIYNELKLIILKISFEFEDFKEFKHIYLIVSNNLEKAKTKISNLEEDLSILHIEINKEDFFNLKDINKFKKNQEWILHKQYEKFKKEVNEEILKKYNKNKEYFDEKYKYLLKKN